MPVRIEREDQIGIVTLDRPDKRNAMNPEMTAQLDDALNNLDDDPSVHAIVLTGAGPAFCSGTDLAAGSGGPTARGGPYGIARRVRVTPLIAAVEGPAVGGGFEIVLACDLVVAAETATFGLPEVTRGVVATCGALFRGPRVMPPVIAAELLLTGDPIDAARAAALGIVNRVVPAGEARDAAVEMARRIVRNSPVAVRATLRALHTNLALNDHLGWLTTDDATRTVLSSPDAAEGKRAFLERREPRWSS